MEQTTQIYEKQLVVFNLGEEEFGVEISEVREIIPIPEITKIPDTEEYIEGIIKLREQIIVIVDIEKKLRLLPSVDIKDRRIVIVEVDGESVGMIVDSCNQVLHIKSDQVKPTPGAIEKKIGNDYLEGVAIIGERLIILLHLKNLLGEKVIAEIKKAKKK